jgi:hypothetical protein
LDCLSDAIKSVEVDESNVDDAFRRRCLLHFAKKIYRTTLSGITLTRAAQSTSAFTLKRNQYYAWVAFEYYYHNERQSVLFCAAGPLKQRDKAKEIMDFDATAEADPKRQRQLADLTELAEAMYKAFPDLRVAKGKSEKSPTPMYIDWSEPSEHAMMEAIVKTWPDDLRKAGQPIPEDDVEDWCRRQVAAGQFFQSSFPSQEMHATPIGLIGDLNAENHEDGETLNLDAFGNDPNAFLYTHLRYPIRVAERLIELSGASGFKNRFAKISKALGRFGSHFQLDET